MRILSLSTCFPNPNEPAKGIFVRSRLLAMARSANIKVMAPVGVFDYSAPHQRWSLARNIPLRRIDGGLEVFHPRWLYPPGGWPCNAGLLALELLPRLRALHRRWPIDVIDAHFAFPDGIAASFLAASLGCPFTVTLRGNETLHGAGGSTRRLMACALRRAARVITVSGRLRDFAASLGAAPENIRVIPNGIDAAIFRPHDRARLRAKFSWMPGTPMILSAGYLIERKGHHRVIRALPALHSRGIPARLVIAGAPGRENPFDRQLRSLVASLALEDAVTFTGEVSASRMAELMSAADVLCLASAREGWPNVVHEALGCGTPVVATDVGGVPDMLPSEEYGFVVPPGDDPRLEAALAAALEKAWDRPAISAWAHRRSWDGVAREVLEEFARITNPKLSHLQEQLS